MVLRFGRRVHFAAVSLSLVAACLGHPHGVRETSGESLCEMRGKRRDGVGTYQFFFLVIIVIVPEKFYNRRRIPSATIDVNTRILRLFSAFPRRDPVCGDRWYCCCCRRSASVSCTGDGHFLRRLLRRTHADDFVRQRPDCRATPTLEP